AALRRADDFDFSSLGHLWHSRPLRPLEAEHLPLLIERYREMRLWQARAAPPHHITGFAPWHDAATQLGIEALNDRSFEVRYRACGLLAYGGHSEAVPYLTRLAQSADAHTAEHARAALEAVAARNVTPFLALDTPRRLFFRLPTYGPY